MACEHMHRRILAPSYVRRLRRTPVVAVLAFIGWSGAWLRAIHGPRQVGLFVAPRLRMLRTLSTTSTAASLSDSKLPHVFLTREENKNYKMRAELDARGLASEELPCIAFERLAGYGDLCDALLDGGHDIVVLTSPEAAATFIDAWRSVDNPVLPALAAVGAGTSAVLEAAGLATAFMPSSATGASLAAELPDFFEGAKAPVVLYPASALASDVVESGLRARGFKTRRIDAYTTTAADWSEDELARARLAALVTFASPSAVRIWAARAGTTAIAVCIGKTTAAEARSVGFQDVRCPESVGIAAWADTVRSTFLQRFPGSGDGCPDALPS